MLIDSDFNEVNRLGVEMDRVVIGYAESQKVLGDRNNPIIIEIWDSGKSTGKDGYRGHSWIKKVEITSSKENKIYVIEGKFQNDVITFYDKLLISRIGFCYDHKATVIHVWEPLIVANHQAISIYKLKE